MWCCFVWLLHLNKLYNPHWLHNKDSQDMHEFSKFCGCGCPVRSSSRLSTASIKNKQIGIPLCFNDHWILWFCCFQELQHCMRWNWLGGEMFCVKNKVMLHFHLHLVTPIASRLSRMHTWRRKPQPMANRVPSVAQRLWPSCHDLLWCRGRWKGSTPMPMTTGVTKASIGV